MWNATPSLQANYFYKKVAIDETRKYYKTEQHKLQSYATINLCHSVWVLYKFEFVQMWKICLTMKVTTIIQLIYLCGCATLP